MPFIPIQQNTSSTSHTHSNLDTLEKIKIDSFGQLYYENDFNPDALKAETILALLGSLNDESGYSNIVTPTPNQQNPVQVLGLDARPALSLVTNSTELSIANVPTLLAASTGATLYAVYSNSNSNGVQDLVRTNGGDPWWRFTNGDGYFGVFRNSRAENYPLGMPLSGNFLVSIHSRSSDYEIFINGQSRGVIGGSWFQGDRFIVCPQGRWCTCNFSLLLVVPFWVDKNSLFHQQKLAAIKGRFPSLPFTL